jgi:transcriptional regulator GlxA family with amidase domain
MRRIAMLAYPGANAIDVHGPLEVFACASRFLAEGAPGVRAQAADAPPAYHVEVVARHRGVFASQSGVALAATRRLGELRGPLDTLCIAGGNGVQHAIRDRALIAWIARAAERSRRVAAVCTGSFLLAETGLLDGRRATTHWRSCSLLAKRYPKLRVESDPIFVRDGRFYTSAGVTAGMDLALALVESDHGRELALAVARNLVIFLKRPGGQAQFSAQLEQQLAQREPLRELQSFIAEHPDADLRVPELARRAGMSPRNFARAFRAELGVTPARFVSRVRIEAAKRHLQEGREDLDRVALACGLGSAEVLRRSFQRSLRVSPSDYRGRFRSPTRKALGRADR